VAISRIFNGSPLVNQKPAPKLMGIGTKPNSHFRVFADRCTLIGLTEVLRRDSLSANEPA
jgi:hypothetical protein